jgi:hypothetical protein
MVPHGMKDSSSLIAADLATTKKTTVSLDGVAVQLEGVEELQAQA